mgnify:CR=1 FL=1
MEAKFQENNKVIVSIIMATYNREAFIEESLASITNQSYTDWECIIIDDGGTDNTAKIIEPILKKNRRFKYLSRTENYKKGLPGCRNMGLDQSSGEYIVFFDDDDIAHPDTLKIAVGQLKNSGLEYCRYLRQVFHGDFNLKFDKNLNFETQLLDKSHIEEMITGKLPFNSCQVLWSKTCFFNIRFNEDLMYAEEWECYSRILMEGAKGVSVEKILYFGRKHPNSNTGEFRQNNLTRKASKVHAVKLVIDNLKKHNLFKESLVKYFLRLGFQIKEPEIIHYTLKKSDADVFKIMKYKIGYSFYPVIKPIFKLKSKLGK